MQETLDIKYSTIFRVTVPLIIGNFIQSLVLITDMAFLSHLGSLEYDAVGNAGLIFFTLYMVSVGMGDAMQILIARYIGQNNPKRIKETFQTGMFVLLSLATFSWIIIQFVVPSVLNAYSLNETIASFQNDYLRIRSYSLFIALTSYGMMAFLIAQGKTNIVFITSIVLSLVNIALDYIFIFGAFGISEMGVEGAALASVLADLSTLIILSVYFFRSKWIKSYALFHSLQIAKQQVLQLFRVAWPLMIQGFIALGTWTVFFFWIEQMGSRELEISQNIRVMYFLAFIPIFGFAATTKTYVSQLIGSGRFDLLAKVQKRILFLVVVTLILFFHGGLLYPEFLISLINPRLEIAVESAQILRQVFPAILLFAFMSVFFNTINGSGNTKASLLIEIVATSLYLFFAYWFIKVLNWDIKRVWYVEYLYFAILSLGSLLYLKLFNWKKTAQIL